MNKIKIYFFKDWVYIAPPWQKLSNESGPTDDLTESRFLDNHDVSVDLSEYTIDIDVDYLCGAESWELRLLIMMLEYAASICENKVTFEKVKLHPDLARSSFPDAEIFIVEE